MQTAAPKVNLLKNYTAPHYLVDKVNLTFNLEPTSTVVHSEMHVRSNPEYQQELTRDVPLILQGEDCKLASITLNQQLLHSGVDFELTSDELRIHKVPSQFVMTIVTEINPAENTALEGLYLTNGRFCTQCEANGFRRITYYQDRPDVMACFETKIIGNKIDYPYLLSNGNLVESGDLPDGKHWARWVDPYPKPAYLFALVAGDLAIYRDTFVTRSGREVTLEIFVESQHLHQCAHAMASLKKAMAWDEATYGLEYDLDIYMIVAVNDFNMGAMENKGLNVFNARCVLAHPETATDQDYLAVERVIAHEYFHNWTGNRVTLQNWFQLSLKEGLTVYRDQLFSADMSSPAVRRLEQVQLMRTLQFTEDAGPTAHPIRPESYIEMNNFYTVTVYEKGAEVIRMIETLVGKAGFRRGMDLYFARHDGQAVTCDDFVCTMEDANKIDLQQFRRWYSQAGTPVVHATWNYDSEAGVIECTFKQSCPPTPGQPDKAPFHIPIDYALWDVQGKRIVDDSWPTIFSLTETTQSFCLSSLALKGLAEAPTPSFMRGFSAPVRLIANYTPAQRVLLLQAETDAVTRFDAVQQLMLETLHGLIELYHQKPDTGLWKQPSLPFITALQQLMEDASQDKAFIAHCLTLPADQVVGDSLPFFDIDSITAAKHQLRQWIATSLKVHLSRVYHELSPTTPYEFIAEGVAARALRNVCLRYLSYIEPNEVEAMAYAQFKQAHCMTDVIAALSILCNMGRGQKALDEFYTRWQHEALVVNKWLSVQANQEEGNVLEVVRSLTQHQAFDYGNPNKVYALLGAFAKQNLAHFHAVSGEGYCFIAEQVVKLDAINPQVASRLVSALFGLRRMDAARKSLMKNALEFIAAQKSLSRDVYEMVGKALAE